jgi:hypothetical protein
MKQYILITIFLAVNLAWAQEDNTISFDNLEVPNTSAFILLDEAPTSIQRPNSTRAFAIDLLQDVADDGMLQNIAVEVTPFWMVKHKSTTPQKFYGLRSTSGSEAIRQNPFAKLRLASLSAAYIKSADSIINVSVGVRTTVFELKRNSDIKAYTETLSTVEKLLYKDADYAEEFEEKMNYPEPEEDDFETRGEYIAARQLFREARAKYIDQREAEDGFNREENKKKFQEIVNRKPIVALDLALAYNQRFYGNTFDNNRSGRFGIWSTISASAFLDKDPESSNYFNLYGFFRYLEDEFPVPNDVSNIESGRFNAFDVGIKGEIEFKKLSFGYEYINRSGDMEGYRSVGSLRYQLWNDIFLTGSFGKNFDESDNLVSLFGIKCGLNHPLQNIFVANSGE